MTRANRWYLYGPFIVAALLVVGWYAVWRHAAMLMKHGVADFVANEAAAGYEVSASPVKVGGFPFFLRGEIASAQISKGDFSYSAEKLFLDVLFYSPNRLIISPAGEQKLKLDGKTWALLTTDARASVERDKTRAWIAKLQTGAVDARQGAERIAFDRSLVNAAPGETDPTNLDISLRIFEARFALSTGEFAISRVDAAGTLDRTEHGPSHLIIHGIDALVEDAHIALKGEIAPDAQGRAEGVLQAQIERPTGFVRALEKAGALSAKDARAAEAGVALFAVATGGNISAPITLKNGEARLAGLKIAKSPKIAQP